MSTRRSLPEAISEEQAVLFSMRKKAEELGVKGVSEMLTKAQVLAYLELAQVPELELQQLAAYSLAQLVNEQLTDDSMVHAALAPLFDIVGRFQRDPEPEKRGEDDQGTNYGGFVNMKLMEALRKNRPSGEGDTRRGEAQMGGAIIEDDFALAFSGGTIPQDVEIVEAGQQAYEKIQEVSQFMADLPENERQAILLDYLKRRHNTPEQYEDRSKGKFFKQAQAKFEAAGLKLIDIDAVIRAHYSEILTKIYRQYFFQARAEA